MRIRSVIIDCSLNVLRAEWERTSFEIEKRQSNPVTAREEQHFLNTAKTYPWHLPDTFIWPPDMEDGYTEDDVVVETEEVRLAFSNAFDE